MADPASYTVVISSRAHKEIIQAWTWYEDRQISLGDRFIKEVFNRIHKIQLTPTRFPTRYKSYKETPVKDFPFLIIYRINKQKKLARIVAVFHTSLNPKKKY